MATATPRTDSVEDTVSTPSPLEQNPNENPDEIKETEAGRARPSLLQMSSIQNSTGPVTPTSGIPRTPRLSRQEKERKIGHRRVDDEGQITYKKIQTSQLMCSIQLGISHSVGGLASKPERDLLMQDFAVIETTDFPGDGSCNTPAHRFAEFRFKTYAPVAFRYFRDLFGIQPDDFLLSMCNDPLRELTNPGASGSIFYLTLDDEFIIKTVQHKEGEFLQKLLPGYYMNLNQNPRTLLPKFFGLYCYQCGGKNIRLVVMNNLLPSSVKIHQKYDLKGSTYKRKASKYESNKPSPTYKDLDFMEHHPEGILLEGETYSALVKTIQRDCRVLESFKIMDYSLLVGIHNLDQAVRERQESHKRDQSFSHNSGASDTDGAGPSHGLTRTKSMNRQKLVAHSTAMEAIQAEVEPIDEDEDVPPGGIPARNVKGERLLLFLGIIDILQSYRLRKKLEHTWKAMLHDGDTVSVHRPGFYAQRFQDFMARHVFTKIPSPLKHSPSRKKNSLRHRPSNAVGPEQRIGEEVTTKHMPTNGRTDIPLSSTPPPSFEEAIRESGSIKHQRYNTDSVQPTVLNLAKSKAGMIHDISQTDKLDAISISHITLKTETTLSTHSVVSESSSATSGISSTIRTVNWTPPHSIEGSTPTHTEGSPSYTESSSSGDLGCPTTPVRGNYKDPGGARLENAVSYQETEITRL